MKQAGWLAAALSVLMTACGGQDEGAAPKAAQSDAPPLPRGVTADTIRIGAHNDLSGPTAAWGVGLTNGMRQRFDEVNAAGGVHGRRIEFLVEDAHYQVPAAVKAANKLLNKDRIFLMVGAMGTPMNNAVLPIQLKAGVPNLFPLTAAVQMYEPLHPMKFSYFVSYRDQIRAGMKYFAEQGGHRKVCLQTVASDYGAEVAAGFDKGVAENGMETVYSGRHKTTETDFTGTVTSIKNSGCELLVLGPIIKDAILIYTAARAAGWQGTVVANMVPYTSELAAAADGGMEGFYAVSQLQLADFAAEVEADTWVGRWYTRYKERFGTEPNVQAEAGHLFADLTVRALEAASPALTTDKVLAAIESISDYADPFGGTTVSFSATKHQGGDYVNLYQVQERQWRLVKAKLQYDTD